MVLTGSVARNIVVRYWLGPSWSLCFVSLGCLGVGRMMVSVMADSATRFAWWAGVDVGSLSVLFLQRALCFWQAISVALAATRGHDAPVSVSACDVAQCLRSNLFFQSWVGTWVGLVMVTLLHHYFLVVHTEPWGLTVILQALSAVAGAVSLAVNFPCDGRYVAWDTAVTFFLGRLLYALVLFQPTGLWLTVALPLSCMLEWLTVVVQPHITTKQFVCVPTAHPSPAASVLPHEDDTVVSTDDSNPSYN